MGNLKNLHSRKLQNKWPGFFRTHTHTHTHTHTLSLCQSERGGENGEQINELKENTVWIFEDMDKLLLIIFVYDNGFMFMFF